MYSTAFIYLHQLFGDSQQLFHLSCQICFCHFHSVHFLCWTLVKINNSSWMILLCQILVVYTVHMFDYCKSNKVFLNNTVCVVFSVKLYNQFE